MSELSKVVVCLFVAVLLFYLIKLFYFTKKKWNFRKYIFIIMISGVVIVFIATFLDTFADYVHSSVINNIIRIFLAVGVIIYIIGIIMWADFTKEMMIKLERLSLIDPMTGIFNRSGIEKLYDSLDKSNKNFYLMLCDLDGTKKVNDTYGHLEGDKYIKSAVKIIVSVIGLKGYLARIGGDEFVILLGYVEIQELQEIITTIKKQAREIYKDGKTGISIGYSLSPVNGKTFKELIKVADEEMYKDKKNKS